MNNLEYWKMVTRGQESLTLKRVLVINREFKKVTKLRWTWEEYKEELKRRYHWSGKGNIEKAAAREWIFTFASFFDSHPELLLVDGINTEDKVISMNHRLLKLNVLEISQY